MPPNSVDFTKAILVFTR